MHFPSSGAPLHPQSSPAHAGAPPTAPHALDAAQLDDAPAVRLLTDTLHAARVRDAKEK